jgi:hypothetical protein
MSELPRVYADFNDLLRYTNRVRLRTHGARADLDRQGVMLEEGLELELYDFDANEQDEPDDLIANGTIYWDVDEDMWMARLDMESIKHRSDVEGPGS